MNQGLEAGLTMSDAREVLVQLYAYAGFPRSLNALAELMKGWKRANSAAFRMRRAACPAAPIPKGEACWPRAPPTRPS